MFFLIPDKIAAVYDVHIAGDHFLQEIYDTFNGWVRLAKRKNKEKPTSLPYLEHFYNVQGFYPLRADVNTNGTARILNAVLDALNTEERLPRFLILALDKDIISDFKKLNTSMIKGFSAVVNFLMQQIEIFIRRKKSQICEKKPGAIGAESDPTVIYIDMIQCQGKFDNPCLNRILDLRYQFNLVLHEAAARQNQHVMSIRSCSAADHFDGQGNLSARGQLAFWHEVDNLLECFDRQDIKLLPHLHLKKCNLQQRGDKFHHKTSYSHSSSAYCNRY